MGLGESLMKIVLKVNDIVELARRFREEPRAAMQEVVAQVRGVVTETLERVMDAEIDLVLGEGKEAGNKRNGYTKRSFAIKGIGEVSVKVPRDRKGAFESKIVPPSRRYDEAIERDIALLNLAGLSTRTLALVSKRVLGVEVSAQEVSNSMATILPAAKKFLERPLDTRRWVYLYVDGTNFSVRRTTVAKEPTLVVLGVDDAGHKSILAMVQGDKDSRGAWEMVFARLKERGLDASAVELGVMDGLPGLAAAFREAFPKARVQRCWVHKARNVFPLVPRRYQVAFKKSWDTVQYATSREAAQTAYEALKTLWGAPCDDAVSSLERDLEALLTHYDFPQAHWDALRTTNPIERINKEFKRRTKSMEQMSVDTLRAMLVFTALRLEFGWIKTPITAANLAHLNYNKRREERLEEITKTLLH
jgi:putative transposase